MSWNNQIIEEFRTNAGRVGGIFDGVPLLLLHNTGARSGVKRINPLVYAPFDGKFIVAASKGGAETHPDWFFNLRANPNVELEVGSGAPFTALATLHESGPERTALYSKLEGVFARFTEYQKNAERTIPIIVFERAE